MTFNSIPNSPVEYALGATANTISVDGTIIGVGDGESNAVKNHKDKQLCITHRNKSLNYGSK